MANRFDWNALDGKIEITLQNSDDLDNRSKALSALAISTVLDVDIEEAIDAITDGGNDRGVDALFIDDRENRSDVHLVQTKCVSEFEKSKNNFPSGEIDKIVSYISDLLNQDTKALKTANPQLQRKTADALEVLRKIDATVTVHFIGNMAALVPDELNRIETVFSRYKAVCFEEHDLDALADFFLTTKQPLLDRELTVIDTNFFHRTDLNLRGMVCTVSALDIVDAIKSENDDSQVELGMFDQNVRVYLKRQNRINRRIIDSALSNENHMFWYQNNGITMTCDKIDVAPIKRSPKIRLTNVQIVNGGQTSNCLFEAASHGREKIEDVLLLLRVIETTSEDVKHSIAESTNSQTPINVRDLRANDRQQRQLEDSFLDLGYFYERKAKQYENEARDRRIDALSAGQAYLGYGNGLPEVAKKDRGRVFGDLYDTVFTEDLTAPKLLVASKLIGEINDRKKAVRSKIRNIETLDEGEMSLIDGAYHILFAVKQISLREGRPLWEFEETRKSIEEALKLVGEIYALEQSNDANFSSNRFFKDARTKDKVTRAVG